MTRTVVLGCGYVGLELASELLGRGHDVIGVRRSPTGLTAIKQAGARPIAADVTDPRTLHRIPSPDTVVYCVSSGGRGTTNARDVYLEGLRTTIRHLAARPKPPSRFVYTSSTGVYGDRNGRWVTEDDPVVPVTQRQSILIGAERLSRTITTRHAISSTVVRLGGIYGPGRYPIERYLTGPVRPGYVNFIHRNDAARAIACLLDRDPSIIPGVVNVVDNAPASRWVFADWIASACGTDPPPKKHPGGPRATRPGKRCSNAKLRQLGFEVEYPSYRAGMRAAVSQWKKNEIS